MSWLAIGGFSRGLGTGLADAFSLGGVHVVGLSRSGASSETAVGVRCDLTDPTETQAVFDALIAERGAPSAYIHNAHLFSRAPFLQTTAQHFENSWRTTVLTAFHASQAVVPSMVAAGQGAVAFLGATASVRAGARFSAFASAKFALRGLAQSLARDVGPEGVHVSHIVVDGVVDGPQAMGRVGREGDVSAASVASVLEHLFNQPRDAWTHELDLRPSTETW